MGIRGTGEGSGDSSSKYLASRAAPFLISVSRLNAKVYKELTLWDMKRVSGAVMTMMLGAISEFQPQVDLTLVKLILAWV